MKTHFFLSPSIEAIELRLFGVSDSLIAMVERDEASPRIAAAVRNSPEWQRRQQAHDGDLPDEAPPDAGPAMPAYLADLARRRAAAQRAALAQAPEAGQIIQVRKIETPRKGQLDWVLQAPLHVLLDAPAETPELWHGWLMSGEASYASWWDFVLQESDGDFDPEAAMVQVWNPVRLYLPMATRVAGRLSMARLQAVRALAGEFATAEAPSAIPEWPGKVAARTTLASLEVTTGSPVRSESDPRRRYQHLYAHASQAITEPARLALLEAAPVGASGIGERLREWAMQQAVVRLVPRLAQPMSGASDLSSIPDLVWDGRARVRLVDVPGSVRTVEVTALGMSDIVCRVRRDGVLLAKITVRPATEAVLSWDLAPGVELVLADDAEQLVVPMED